MAINRKMDKEAVVHTYNGILLSHKKNEIMPFAATCLDLKSVVLSMSDTEGETSYSILYIRTLWLSIHTATF